MGNTTVLTIVDPADGSHVGALELATNGEVEAAVLAAVKAAPEWARTAAAGRASMVRAAADRVAAATEDLARWTTREMGKPASDARAGVTAGAPRYPWREASDPALMQITVEEVVAAAERRLAAGAMAG